MILAAADNQALTDAILRLRAFFPKDYVTRALTSVDELLAINVDQHESIEAALRAGDGARARRVMEDHVAHAGHLLIDYLDGQRFWDDRR